MGERPLLVLFLTCMLIRVQPQQSEGINLTSSGEPCFGQTFTLTCTHPDPFQDTAKYLGVNIGFFEQTNNEELEFYASDTAQKFNYSRLSNTVSTLSFNLTEEDYANVVLNCSCFLTLTGGGGKEESNPITINIEETIQPPTLVSTPNSTSGLLQWRPSSNCSNYRYIFTLTWVRIGDGITGTVSTEENRYDFTGMPGGEYTVSLKTRVTNFNLTESKPVNDCWITIIQPPTLVSKPNSASGLLQWRPSSNCSNYQYIFTLTWVRTGDNSTGTNATAENWYDFTGMPGGNYTVNITAAIAGVNLSESEPLSVNFTAPSMTETSTEDQASATKPSDDLTGIYIGAGVSAVLILIAIGVIGVIVAAICYSNCRNRKKRVSQSSPKLKGGSSELNQLPPNTSLSLKKQEADNQIQYADIDFSHQMPIAPPPLETTVEYTETVQQFRNTRENRPAPPLPAKTEEEEEEEKKLAQEAAEITPDFKAQAVAILQESKLVYHSLDPEEPVVGTYRGKTFVVSFVHAPGGKEIPASEVDAIIKARELQSTDKGFLMATTDSISGPWLEYLEKHNCHFIGLSRKGGVKKEMLLRKLSICFTEPSYF